MPPATLTRRLRFHRADCPNGSWLIAEVVTVVGVHSTHDIPMIVCWATHQSAIHGGSGRFPVPARGRQVRITDVSVRHVSQIAPISVHNG
jgi:hypothetical protein